MTQRMTGLAVVIPTLNAAATLAAALGPVQGHADEIVVADSGSDDSTRALAQSLGARVIDAPCGRGPQLAAGAAASTAPWLLFLHADTVLRPGWAPAAARFMAQGENAGHAAYFRFEIDLPGAGGRRLEHFVAWRGRRLGLPYGDQGLLLCRETYDRLGGYRPLPIMEDVDLVRRLGRRRIVALDAAAVTSGARYRRRGIVARGARNLSCLALYYLGLPPAVISRLYG
jgi:rSAM/selenodomain-associated transferase 2